MGIWATDERGRDPEAEPFDVWGNGCGLFSCRRQAWLGFSEHFRGFGGEEGYIHEKFREAGRRVLCLPSPAGGTASAAPTAPAMPTRFGIASAIT